MNAYKNILTATAALLITTGLSAQLKGGDQIITTNGKVLKGNVKKVKNDEITYRKYFRKHTIDSDKVLYIVDENGKKTEINKITMAKNYKNYSDLAKSNPPPGADTVKKITSSFKPLYIERIGNSYRVDTTRIVSAGKMNDLISQNPNPLVQINLKTAKTMRTLTTISKITSFPSSAGGAFASYKTFTALFEQLKAGPAPFKSYLTAGLSFMGTISVPITSGILKKIQKKMYDKTLTLYSM